MIYQKTIPNVLALLTIRKFMLATDQLIKDNNIEKFLNNYIEFENDIHDDNYGMYFEYKEKLINLNK